MISQITLNINIGTYIYAYFSFLIQFYVNSITFLYKKNGNWTVNYQFYFYFKCMSILVIYQFYYNKEYNATFSYSFDFC